MSSKRQTTREKMVREQAVRERRARKLERKRMKKDDKLAAAAAATAEAEGTGSEGLDAPETEPSVVLDEVDTDAEPLRVGI